LGSGSVVARLGRHVGLRADVAERLQPLARLGRHLGRRLIFAPAATRSSAPRSACRACGRSPAMLVRSSASRCRSYSSSRGALM
jgi:hypothetical protein